MKQIIVTINPDLVRPAQCATYCDGVFHDSDGCCSWTADHESRGPECLAAEAKRDALRGDSEFRLMREQLASACAEVNRLRADLREMARLWNSHSEWWGKDGSKHDTMIALARKHA